MTVPQWERAMTVPRRPLPRLLALAACVLLLGGCGGEGQAETLSGRVVRVRDGDSVVLLAGGREVEIRLAEVDAPERTQPFSNRAKQALSALVFGKTVEAEVIDVDSYGRKVARLVVDEQDVSSEMVRGGHAFVFVRYARRAELFDLEREAKAAGRGLWALPEAERIPPWEWRRTHRRTGRAGIPPEEAAPPATPQLGPVPSDGGGNDESGRADGEAPFRCGTKTSCREMTSCAEARFHLETCRLPGIDGDSDGRPCEKLCNP